MNKRIILSLILLLSPYTAMVNDLPSAIAQPINLVFKPIPQRKLERLWTVTLVKETKPIPKFNIALIREGMTYPQVAEVLGQGEVLLASDFSVSYSWKGLGIARFKDSKLAHWHPTVRRPWLEPGMDYGQVAIAFRSYGRRIYYAKATRYAPQTETWEWEEGSATFESGRLIQWNLY